MAWEGVRDVLRDALREIERLDPDTRPGLSPSSSSTPSRRSSSTRTGSSDGGPSTGRNAYEEHRALFSYSPTSSVKVSGKRRGGKLRAPPRKKPTLWVKETACLLYKDQTKPPTTEERIRLARVGLGAKDLSFDTDGDGFHVHSVIMEHYPELEGCGGYCLMRIGSGSNELVNITPQKDGVMCVSYLRDVLKSAKLYVRPLQKDLDVSSLEAGGNEHEHEEGPSGVCWRCSGRFSLCQLQHHIRTCKAGMEQAEQHMSTDSSLVESQGSPSPPYSPTPNDTPVDVEEEQLSQAIEASLHDEYHRSGTRTCNTLADCIQELQRRVRLAPFQSLSWDADVGVRNVIDVRRNFLLVDTLREANKTNFDVTRLLQVNFVGEAAVDAGGPSREFWRLLVSSIGSRYCCGERGKMFFDTNTPALRCSELKTVGKLVAMSIVQGGPGLPILSPLVYDFITTGTYPEQILDCDVPNPEVRSLIAEMRASHSEESLQSIFHDEQRAALLNDTGFRKPLSLIKLDDKEELVHVLCQYYSFVKGRLELDSFIEGLNVCDVLGMMQQYPLLMRPLLTSSSIELTKQSIKSLFKVVYSEEHGEEEQLSYIYFMDFLDECQSGELDVCLRDVLVFFTGAEQIPPLGFEHHARLTFHNGQEVFPKASTCTLELTLPILHEHYTTFKQFMVTALKEHGGFGKV